MAGSVGSVTTGALGGWAAAGPIGAGIGALGGLFGSSSRSMPELAPYSAWENRLIGEGGNLTSSALRQLQADPTAWRRRLEGSIFNPMSQQINLGYAQGRSQDRISMFGRGLAGSSQAERGQRQSAVDQAGALGNAKYQSILGGESMFQQQQAGLRANAQTGQGIMDSQYRARLGRSGMTNTLPNSEYNTGMGMFGLAMGAGSKYLGQANQWIGGQLGFGGAGGSGVDTSSATNWLANHRQGVVGQAPSQNINMPSQYVPPNMNQRPMP